MTASALTLDQLLAARCTHVRGEPMSSDAVREQLLVLPRWALREASASQRAALVRTYAFDDFYRTMAFVNAMAWVFHREDHHADLQVSHGTVTVALDTHSVGGISINDFICAARLDASHGA